MNGYGVCVPALVREILAREGVDIDTAEEVSQEVSRVLDGGACRWVETLSGKTFEVSFVPSGAPLRLR